MAAFPLLAMSPYGLAYAQDVPAAPAEGPRIGVRVGSHPGYGRVVFDWPVRTGYEAVAEGEGLAIRFAAPGRPQLGSVPTPRNVTGLVTEGDTVRILARDGARFRHFHHGPKLVVDILDPDAPAAAAASVPVPRGAAQVVATPAPSTMAVMADLAGAMGIAAPERPVARGAVLASIAPGPEAVRPPGPLAPDILLPPVPATIQLTQALPQSGPRGSAPFNVPMQAPPPGISLLPQAQAQAQAPQIPGVPQVVTPAPGATLTRPLVLEQGAGRLVELPSPALTVLVADPRIARVQPASPTSLFIMGVNAGRTNLIATREDGSLVAEFDITVASNAAGTPQAPGIAAVPAVTASQVQSMIRRMVRGGQNVRVTMAGRSGAIQLSGMVPTAADAQRAEAIAKSMAGEQREVVNDLTLLSGIQVNLRVRVAEISREVTRDLGFNWLGVFQNGNWALGLRSGSVVGTAVAALTSGLGLPGALAAGSGTGTGGTYGMRYQSGGWDINGLVDALAQDRLLTVLAEPNLTAQSGEVASFLAGGEFPVPEAAAGNSTTISVVYKPYGVSLSFVPTVLSPERMNMRVRPEVSELSETGSISFPVAGGVVSIPGLTVRRAETTIELGSGQSFAIAGLLSRNASINNSGVAGLGDLPVLGALFRSDRFRRNETELVIIITPYLVRPTSDPSTLATPLDTFRPATDLERILLRRQTGSGAPYRQIRPPAAAGFIVE